MPGTYEYKFIVDGEWMHDPLKDFKPDNRGGYNNIVKIDPNAVDDHFTDYSDNDNSEIYFK